MNQLRSSNCVVFIFVTLLLAQAVTTCSPKMDAKGLSSVVAGFSARFCNELEKNKSVVSSPLSAEVLLALLTLGASEPAHKELLTSLGIPNDESIRSSFTSVSQKLKSVKGITLSIANKVYVKDGDYELTPALKADAVSVFDASFEKTDFGNGAAAAELINKWVEGKTNKRIKDLFKSDDLSEDTRLVLVNALYFKGSWKNQFDRRHTRELPFHVNEGTTINVPMMYKEDKFRYGESQFLNAQLLEMSYEGEEASMLVVLPNEVEGLAEVMQKLASGYDLLTELDKMSTTKVQVTLPKFKIETEIDLNSLLPKLGIKTIFDSRSNCLNKILTNGEPLFVSKAVQKAFIEVNEEGAEAAAATGVAMMLRCMPMPSPRFLADHPFYYVLLSGAERTPLFVGTFNGQN